MSRSTASFLTVALLSAALTVSGCENSEDRAERHFNSGIALVESGEISQALLEFRNALRLQPGMNEARLQIARLQRERGVIGEAFREYLGVVEREPDTLEARVALAEISLNEGNWDEAERHGRAAEALAPDLPEVRLVSALLDYRDAATSRDRAAMETPVATLRELLAAGADNVIAWRVLIDHSLSDDDRERGLAQVTEALVAQPDVFDFHMMQLRLLAELERTDAVLPALQELMERFPDAEDPPRLKVAFLLEQGRREEAEDFLRQRAAAETAAGDGTVVRRLQLAEFLQATAGTDATLAELDRLLAEDPEQMRLAGLRASLRFSIGDTATAIAELRERLAGAEMSDDANDLRVLLARLLRATGEIESSTSELAAVLEADPGHVDGLKLHASALIDNDRPGEAITALRRAQSGAPRDPEIMVLMARAHERDGDRDLAGERYAQAVEMSGEAPRESLLLANYLRQENRLDAAETVLAAALRRSPDHVELTQTMGTLLLQRGAYDRVQRMIWQLRARDTARATQLADALEADLLVRQGRREETIAFLEGMVREGGGQPGVLAALVQTQLMEGQVDGARALIDERLAEAPEDPVLRFLDAGLLVLAGDLDGAESRYRALLAEFPAAEPPARALYAVLQAQGRNEDAEGLIEELIAASPDAVMPRLLRAATLERRWDIEGAIAIYEELYERDRSNLVIANNLASLMSAHREDAESLDRAHAIARRLRGSDVPAFQDTYGWILYRLGRHEDALEYLQPAAAGLPRDALVQFHLGMTYLALERHDEARETLARALEIAGGAPLPQFDRAREVLEELGGL